MTALFFVKKLFTRIWAERVAVSYDAVTFTSGIKSFNQAFTCCSNRALSIWGNFRFSSTLNK